MKDGGYFKLYRRAFRDVDHGGDPLWNEHRVWSRAEAWLYLLAITAHGVHDKPLKGGRVVRLERGQFFASLRYLARKWGWSKDKVARFLLLLESHMARIARQRRDTDGDTYLIVNWDVYQSERDTKRGAGETPARQGRDTGETKEKKEEEGIRRGDQEKSAPGGAGARVEIPSELAAIPGFSSLWAERIAALPSSRRPTPRGQVSQLRQMLDVLAKHGPAATLAAIEEAINRKWTGFKAEWVNGRSSIPISRQASGLGPADLRQEPTEAEQLLAVATAYRANPEAPWNVRELRALAARAGCHWPPTDDELARLEATHAGGARTRAGGPRGK